MTSDNSEQTTIDLDDAEEVLLECRRYLKDLSIHLMKMKHNINVHIEQHI